MSTNNNPTTTAPGSSGLRQLTASQQAQLNAARVNQQVKAPVGNEMTVNPRDAAPTSTSSLRPMTPAEQQKIDTARQNQLGTTTPESALIPNPRDSQGMTPNPRDSQTTTPQPGQTPAPAPSVPSNLTPAESGQRVTGMTRQEQQAVQQAMQGFVGTLGEYWTAMQKIGEQISGFTPQFQQPGAAGAQAGVAGAQGAMTGQETPQGVDMSVFEEGAPRQTPQIGFDKVGSSLGVDASRITQAEQANQVAQAKQNSTTTGSTVSLAPAGSEANKAMTDLLNDPIASTLVDQSVDPNVKNVQQLAEYMQSAMAKNDVVFNRQVENLMKKSESYQEGARIAEMRVERDAYKLMERTEKEYQKALQDSYAEEEKGLKIKERALKAAEERSSRISGYMVRQMNLRGMGDSSAGMYMLEKYTSLAVEQVNDRADDMTDYAAAMSANRATLIEKASMQMQDIMDSRDDKLFDIRKDAYDKLLETESVVLQSSAQKIQQEMSIMTQLTQLENQANMEAHQKAIQIQSQALEEAKFSWAQINDMKEWDYKAETLQLQVDQFDWSKDMDLSVQSGLLHMGGKPVVDPATGEYVPTMQGRMFNQQIDEFLTSAMGTLHRNGQDTGELTMARDQWNRTFNRSILESDRTFARGVVESDRAYQYDLANFMTTQTGDVYDPVTGELVPGLRSINGQIFDQQLMQSELDRTLSLVNSGVLDKDSLNRFRSEFDVMSSGIYYGREKTSLGERFQKGIEAAAKFMGNSNWQCVQFVRAIFPDLPYGLTTLGDKVRNLIEGEGGFLKGEKEIIPGDVVVMDMGTEWGHVATVLKKEGSKITLLDHNRKAPGKVDANYTIDLNSKNIKGFWRSPSIAVEPQAMDTNLQRSLDLATAGMGPSARQDYRQLAMEYAKQGDLGTVAQLIQKAAIDNMPNSVRQEYETAGQHANAFSNASRTLEQFKGGNPGVWNRVWEENKSLAQLERDKEWAETTQSVFFAGSQIMNQLYGAALTESELKRAGLFLPHPNMTFRDFYNNTKGIERLMLQKQGFLLTQASGQLPPQNAQGMIDTPHGPVTPSEYQAMMWELEQDRLYGQK